MKKVALLEYWKLRVRSAVALKARNLVVTVAVSVLGTCCWGFRRWRLRRWGLRRWGLWRWGLWRCDSGDGDSGDVDSGDGDSGDVDSGDGDSGDVTLAMGTPAMGTPAMGTPAIRDSSKESIGLGGEEAVWDGIRARGSEDGTAGGEQGV
jgi:hypothetical protein